VDSQAEAAPAIPIPFCEDFEYLEFADDMFTDDALAGEGAILLPLCAAEDSAPSFLLRRSAVGV